MLELSGSCWINGRSAGWAYSVRLHLERKQAGGKRRLEEGYRAFAEEKGFSFETCLSAFPVASTVEACIEDHVRLACSVAVQAMLQVRGRQAKRTLFRLACRGAAWASPGPHCGITPTWLRCCLLAWRGEGIPAGSSIHTFAPSEATPT